MFGHHHHHHRPRGCGPRGRGGFERFAAEFAARWDEAQRGGGRRRMFDGGELRLVLLHLIAQGPRHGYELIREVEAMTSGAYVPSAGVVYPTLTLLADMELTVEEQGEGVRKRFAITDAGRAHLAEREGEVEALVARLKALGEMRSRGDHGPVRRAMGNLKSALQHRLAAEHEPELAHDIAAILDEAVQKIERLK